MERTESQRLTRSQPTDCNSKSLCGDNPSTMPPPSDKPVDATCENEVVQDVGSKRKTTSMSSSNVLYDPKEEREYLEGKSKKRAKYWDTFKEYKTKSGVKRAECKFCEKTFASDSNLIGTKNIKSHATKCPMNSTLTSIGSGTQSKLVLQPVEGNGEVRLQTWVMNPKHVKEAIAYMIVVDELPFRIVEKAGFRHFVSVACPNFKMPSRNTIRRACYQLYLNERAKLKLFLQNSCQRVCVTTDSWTSCQRVNYMCLTAHFIDNDWKLQKRILNFCPILGHKGEQIGKSIEACLLPWGLDGKLFTVTVDNASSNDVACNYLRKMASSKGWVCDGKYLHMRCIAHIFNLIVWDGLKEYKNSVSRVRNAIKYVRNSPQRLKSFKQCVDFLKIDCKLSLSLDVPTRWNSTYLMLDTALKFRRVFDRTEFPTDFDAPEENGNDDVDRGSPTDGDWATVTSLVTILKKFYDLTNKVSATLHVTCNTALFDITSALSMITLMSQSDDYELKKMASKMKEKFDKYWGNVEKMNMLVYIAVVLDPKMKMVGVKVSLNNMHGENMGRVMLGKVKEVIHDLFDEYNQMYMPAPTTDEVPTIQPQDVEPDEWWLLAIEQETRKERNSSGTSGFMRSELDRYLNEDIEDKRCKDILLWWKLHSPRFPNLARMARDILAMPVSTVASESAFSAGGRHLDSFRSSLLPKTVQGLICGQDWIRQSSRPEAPMVGIEEVLEELEEFEKELPTETMDEEHEFAMYS